MSSETVKRWAVNGVLVASVIVAAGLVVWAFVGNSKGSSVPTKTVPEVAKAPEPVPEPVVEAAPEPVVAVNDMPQLVPQEPQPEQYQQPQQRGQGRQRIQDPAAQQQLQAQLQQRLQDPTVQQQIQDLVQRVQDPAMQQQLRDRLQQFQQGGGFGGRMGNGGRGGGGFGGGMGGGGMGNGDIGGGFGGGFPAQPQGDFTGVDAGDGG